MSVESLEELLSRIARLKERMAQRGGAGDAIKSSDEFETTVIVESVKPANEVDDDLAAIFVWLWSVRDYIIAKVTEGSIKKSLVDVEIDKHLCLKLCSDIANRQKHQNLSKSRSGRFARILKSGYSIPQEAIGRITCEGRQTTFAISQPAMTRITADIVDNEDNRIIGAIECIEQSLEAWACISRGFEIDF
jgi:hypothetical protein